jgi:succinyl-diaminopimelate desuccinylase
MVNVRFNDAHSGQSLCDWIETEADRAAAECGVGIAARFQLSGESFVTEPGPFTDLVVAAVHAETGLRPKPSTTGGTSDARFVKDHCPVVEVGLVGSTMHQVDERVEVVHIEALKRIYLGILGAYFAG